MERDFDNRRERRHLGDSRIVGRLMKKLLFFLLFLLSVGSANAQVTRSIGVSAAPSTCINTQLFFTASAAYVCIGGIPTLIATGAGGANTALSNLASVAINTTLLSDTDATDDLGSASFKWRDLHLGRNALSTTSTPSLYLTNATAATGGTPRQFPPALLISGASYDTDGAASIPQQWRIDGQPLNGNVVQNTLVFASKVGSDPFRDVLSIDNRYGIWLRCNLADGSGFIYGDGSCLLVGSGSADQAASMEFVITLPAGADTLGGTDGPANGYVFQSRQNGPTNTTPSNAIFNGKADNGVTNSIYNNIEVRGKTYAGTTSTVFNQLKIMNPESGGTYTNLSGITIDALTRGGTSNKSIVANNAIEAPIFSGNGTIPAVATCGTIGTGSKNFAGFITSTVTGACVAVVTFTATATTGWSCGITNATTANLITQTGSSTTTATFTGTTVTGDVLRYVCGAY